MPFFILIFVFVLAGLNSSATEKVQIGKYKTRGLLSIASCSCKTALVILVPGSGAKGPEVMFPGKVQMGNQFRQVTADGIDHSIFQDFMDPLNQAGVSTFAIGKPGVDFFNGWSDDFGVSYYVKDL